MAKKKDEEKTGIIEKILPSQPKMVSSKAFAKSLRKELKGEKISESVYIAFERVVKSIDSEENYRKIWKTTFKRA